MEIEKLKAEVERLKQENETFKRLYSLHNDRTKILARRIIRLEEELKRERELNGEKSVFVQELFEILKKCDPLKNEILSYCEFCNNLYEHKEDCQYLRLTEEG